MNPSFRRFALSLFVVVCAFATARAQTTVPYTWKNVAIKGGGFVSGLAYHPMQRDLLYARTDVGGAFRWRASDNTWVPLNDDIGGLTNAFMDLGVLSIGLDPRDANRVYLACGQYVESWAPNAALLSSTDQGATWSRTTLPFKLGGNQDGRSTGERLQVDPNDGRILLLGSNANGLWRSIDRGATWAQLTSFSPTSITALLFDPRTGAAGSATSTIYVGVNTTTASSLYRSTDGGASWNPMPGQPSGLIPHHLKLSADGFLYLTYCNGLGPNGVTSGAVWKLRTSDGTWTDITPPTGQGGFAGLALDGQQTSTLMVTTLDRWSPRDEIYRSTDGGDTWKALNALSDFNTAPAPYSSSLTPHWLGALEIDPFNSGRAFFITGFGVWSADSITSADSSNRFTWTFRNDGLEETVPLGLVSPPSGAPLVSVIGDFDGFRHDDLAVSPSRGRHTPNVGTSNTIDFAELAPSIMVRTHSGGAVRGTRSTDGGATWSYFGSAPATIANGQGAIAISANGTRLVWMPSRSAAYFSADNGATWSPSNGGPPSSSNSFTPVADRVNSSKFYIYDSAAGRVYTSTDGGANFAIAATSLPTGGNALRAVPGFEGHLWLGAWNSGLYRSIDSGASFTKVTTVQEGNRVGFGKAAPGQTHPAIFLWGRIGGTTGFFRSDDTGASWIRINDDAHQYGYINALTGDPRIFGRIYLATGGRGIIYGDVTLVATALASYDWAPFVAGTTGTYIPKIVGAGPFVFTAQNLPTWATLDSASATISGTPTDSVGTIRQITLRATDTAGAVSTMTLNLLVAAPGNDLRLFALSTRAQVGTDANVLIPGIVIAGTEPRRFLIRAGGPALAAQGVTGTLADPKLTLIESGVTRATNDDWQNQSGAAELVTITASVGLPPLSPSSKDAVLLAILSPGVYTAKIEGVASGTGVALMEIYDTSSGPANGQLTAISARATVGSGSDVLIPGLAFIGGGSRRVIVRALGPTLANSNVPGVLADPELTLYSGGTALATNDDWNSNGNVAEVRAASQSVGLAALPEGSKDAVLLATLVQGGYTLKVAGKNGQTGVALVELYLLP